MLFSSNFCFAYRKYGNERMFRRTVFPLLGGCRCRSKNYFRSATNSNQMEKGAHKRSMPPNNQMRSSNIIKPTIFTLLFSSASFGGAAIWQYENMRRRAKELIQSPNPWLADKSYSTNLWLREKFDEYSYMRGSKRGSFRQVCNRAWNSLSEAQKTFSPILFANVLVFVAWRVPSIRPLMMRYFVSSPSQHSSWPLLFCTFSHVSTLHLMANMFVLHSFIAAIVPTLGREQFVAFYLSAGVISALASYTYRKLILDAALSMGASGAIMGLIGYACVKRPDDLLSVLFIPFFTFKASTGLAAIMVVDLTCLLMKFKLFDHMAHLAGASFGIFWHVWGNENVWQKRGPLLEYWHKLRTSSTK